MTLRHRTSSNKEQIRHLQDRQLQVSESIERCARNLIPNLKFFPLLSMLTNLYSTAKSK